MKILAFDAATAACSAAVWRDGTVVARRFEEIGHGHARVLMPMIMDVLAEAGLTFADLDAVAVTVGPGGFTGLRVGISTARGIGLASRLPVLGVTTLEAVAANVPAGQRSGHVLAVALDTRRSDIYAQAFAEDGRPLSEPLAVDPAEAAQALPPGPVRIVGDASAVLAAAVEVAGRPFQLADAPGVPDAAVVAAIAASRLSAGDTGEGPPTPLYLRPPDVKLPTADPRGRA